MGGEEGLITAFFLTTWNDVEKSFQGKSCDQEVGQTWAIPVAFELRQLETRQQSVDLKAHCCGLVD